MIWDLRDSVETDLCFGISNLDVCCDCDSCSNPCNSYTITNVETAFAEIEYYQCGETTPTTITVLPNRTVTICNNRDYSPSVISGAADITIINECGC